MKRYPVWRYLYSKPASGQSNMATDRKLFNNFNPAEDLPVFRIYSWSPPALSVGKFQDLDKLGGKESIERESVPLIRRLTGGGAIYHDSEITYSMAFPRDMVREYPVPDSYRAICGFLLKFYEKLGYRATYAGREKGYREEKSPVPVCFTGREKYDIIIDGRKAGGNAQKRSREKVFQHGSIPLDIDYKKMSGLFKMQAPLKDETFCLRGHEFNETVEILSEAFREYFNCEFTNYS